MANRIWLRPRTEALPPKYTYSGYPYNVSRVLYFFRLNRPDNRITKCHCWANLYFSLTPKRATIYRKTSWRKGPHLRKPKNKPEDIYRCSTKAFGFLGFCLVVGGGDPFQILSEKGIVYNVQHIYQLPGGWASFLQAKRDLRTFLRKQLAHILNGDRL